MRIAWNTVADYVESGLLKVDIVEGSGEDKTTIESGAAVLDLSNVFADWKVMESKARYAGGNGVKQICGDAAAKNKGDSSAKVGTILDAFSDLCNGVMPGTGSQLSMVIVALSRYHDVDHATALKAWDGYSDDKKADVKSDKKIKSHMADIRQERLDEEKNRLAALDDESDDLEL